MTDFLERQCRQNQNIYLMGDFNIDLLKYETCSYTQNLLQTMQRDCSYLLYDINRQTAPVSILNQFVKTSQIHQQDLSLATRFMLSSLEPIKCMPFSRESVPKFGTLFVIRLKYLNICPFVKK